MDFMLEVLSSEYSYSESSDTWEDLVRRCSKDVQQLSDEDTTDCASDATASSSETEPELEPEMDGAEELLAAHEAAMQAMQEISSTVETPLATMVPAQGCDAREMLHRMKKVLDVDSVTDKAFDFTLLLALKLLRDVEYTLEDVVGVAAHACALAKRCPEAITIPIYQGNLRLGVERIVSLVALAMIDLDDEACELSTWRRYVLPHMEAKTLDACVQDMFANVGWTTHVTAEEWQNARAELGF